MRFEVGTTSVSTENNGVVSGHSLQITNNGASCAGAGTTTILAIAVDGTQGTLSASWEGTIDVNCGSPELARDYVDIQAKAVDVPFLVQVPPT